MDGERQLKELAASCGLCPEVTARLIQDGITSPQIFASRVTNIDVLNQKLAEWLVDDLSSPAAFALQELWGRCQVPTTATRPRDSTPSGRPKGKASPKGKAKKQEDQPEPEVVEYILTSLVVCGGFFLATCLACIMYEEGTFFCRLACNLQNEPAWTMMRVQDAFLKLLAMIFLGAPVLIFILDLLEVKVEAAWPGSIAAIVGVDIRDDAPHRSDRINFRINLVEALIFQVAFMPVVRYATLQMFERLSASGCKTFESALERGDVLAARWFYRAQEIAPSWGRNYPPHVLLFNQTKVTVGDLVDDLVDLTLSGIPAFIQFVGGSDCKFVHPSTQGHVGMVSLLLEKGENPNHPTSSGKTSLFFAGHVAVAKLLLDGKADVHSYQNASGRTALHEAALKGNVDIAQLLLQEGASLDPKARFKPLHDAAEGGHTQMVDFLLEQGAELHAMDQGYNDEMGTGETALHMAAYMGHKEVVQQLVKAKGDVHATTTLHSWTTRWGAKTVLDIAKEYHSSLLPILNESDESRR